MMHSSSRLKRHFLPIALSVLPHAILLLLLLVDPRSVVLGVAVSSLSFILTVVLLVVLTIQSRIECVWRRAHCDFSQYPLFSITTGVFLLFSWVPLLMLPPILKTIPACNVVTKSIEWQTEDGNLILVLNGTGNADRHSFLSGRIKWTGGSNAGFTSLHIRPLELQHDYFEPYFPGSKIAIQHRLSSTNLAQDRIEAFAMDLWNILQQAKRGKQISSQLGTVNAAIFRVNEIFYYRVSGFVWLLSLVAALLLVGAIFDYQCVIKETLDAGPN